MDKQVASAHLGELYDLFVEHALDRTRAKCEAISLVGQDCDANEQLKAA